jgi:beta-lactamase regulating signal transducer with metallopeptidase domain
MSKFLKVTLWIFGGFIGTIILIAVILGPDTRTLEDPGTRQINACAQKQIRIQHPTTKDHTDELRSWCVREHYGLNR